MKEISINELQVNPYTLFGKDWMALTAADYIRHHFWKRDMLIKS